MQHDWRIPEREYQRQLERRGRLHAFERLEPATTALTTVYRSFGDVRATAEVLDLIAAG
ncbi:hypothetical protein [Phenylobacterium sp.]|uniref:hypothetical protein n=1 Tax=Phenylobacterium sp. TaxID=1871053 RepID=UPI0025D48568|nr:hypothetical protein [Phenylobacterium sp.]MBX3483573.1 hypothetical protein [Phenylobacterium sp.]